MPACAPAPLVALAIAVAADLNAHADQFCLPFLAVRGYVPRFDLQDLSTRRVVVCPGGTQSTAADRGRTEHTHRLLIGVLKRLTVTASDNRTDVATLDELDAEIAFVDELRRWFAPDDNGIYTLDSPAVQVASAACDPVYDHEKLHETRQFTSVVTVEFEEVRP